jgi:CBS domain-containing protein
MAVMQLGTLSRVMRPPAWCDASDPIREVAIRMAESAQSCALVRDPRGLGIVTDHDFRLVATGRVPVDAPIAEITTVPALSVDASATGATALLRMLEHGVHHLVVIDASGTPISVLRAVELARLDLVEPLIIQSAIDRAPTLDALAEVCRRVPAAVADLRVNEVPAPHAGAVHSTLVDAVVRRVLTLLADPMFAAVRCSWLVLGSHARREPLPNSDLDTALMWITPAEPPSDLGDRLRTAARSVLNVLRDCGLNPCPNGASADHPRVSRSQAEWSEAIAAWMRDPALDGALVLAALVADSRPVIDVELGQHLTDTLMSHTRTHWFLRALLDEALGWRTATGHLRDFIVDRKGAHRGQLDLKRGGLVPVVALGRWIAVVTGDGRGTTPERLRRGTQASLITADEADTLVVGFENIYTVLFDHEVRCLQSGAAPDTYIDPRDLCTLTQRHLRETLRAVAVVQDRVDRTWIRRLDRG